MRRCQPCSGVALPPPVVGMALVAGAAARCGNGGYSVILRNCFLSFGAFLVEKTLSEERRKVEL
jgi:hypothetical protein